MLPSVDSQSITVTGSPPWRSALTSASAVSSLVLQLMMTISAEGAGMA